LDAVSVIGVKALKKTEFSLSTNDKDFAGFADRKGKRKWLMTIKYRQ